MEEKKSDPVMDEKMIADLMYNIRKAIVSWSALNLNKYLFWNNFSRSQSSLLYT